MALVKFAGLPVPGATITATMGDKKMVAVSDPQGQYSFAELADGVWNLQVEMLCFSTLKMEVAVAPNFAEPGMGAEAAAVRRDQGVGAATGSYAGGADAGHAGCHTAIGNRAGGESIAAQAVHCGRAAEERLQGKGRGHYGGRQTAGRISAGRGECFRRAVRQRRRGTRGGRRR